jgi:hypothetical protein
LSLVSLPELSKQPCRANKQQARQTVRARFMVDSEAEDLKE